MSNYYSTMSGTATLNKDNIETWVFTFGKYKGEKLIDVLDTDARYVKWCLDNIPWLDADGDADAFIESYIRDQESEVEMSIRNWAPD